jgi:hypothetical protein
MRKAKQPLSLYCKHCMGFVPHVCMPMLQPDMRLRLAPVCTHCGRPGGKIGTKATAESAPLHLDPAPGAAVIQRD